MKNLELAISELGHDVIVGESRDHSRVMVELPHLRTVLDALKGYLGDEGNPCDTCLHCEKSCELNPETHGACDKYVAQQTLEERVSAIEARFEAAGDVCRNGPVNGLEPLYIIGQTLGALVGETP
jgi:hypothetical protein